MSAAPSTFSEVRRFLQRTYPVLFQRRERVMPPLAIGTTKVLLELHPEISADLLRRAVRAHTSTVSYQAGLGAGLGRYGLAGAFVEPPEADAINLATWRFGILRTGLKKALLGIGTPEAARAFGTLYHTMPLTWPGEKAQRFLMSVMRHHPEYEAKKGPGIQAVTTILKGSKPSFAILHPDGALTTINIVKCLLAMRAAQEAEIDAIKMELAGGEL